MTEEKRFAVTGNPVLHSKSPLMFNGVFRYQGLETSYSYTRIAAVSAEEAIFLFNELKLTGMNVTAPFKKEIMAFMNTVEPAAARIGGVNTVIRDSGGLKGCNTDWIGVVEALRQNQIPLNDRRCIVLGAGGAGGAAIYGLTREKADVIILDQDHPKALEAAGIFGGKAEKTANLEKLLSSAQLLISAIPAEADVIPAAWLKRDLVVFDANYKKSFLSEKALSRGCRVIKGQEWLLNQAIPAYRHFLGTSPGNTAVETMKASLSAPPPARPENIALVGFMGCGKTVTGKILAQKLGFRFRDTDALIEAREGRTIPEIFNSSGEPYFRGLEKEVLKGELKSHRGVVYGCGGGAVLDDENKHLLKSSALVVWLYSSIPTTLKRIVPGTRPLLDCPDPEAKARELLERRLHHYARAADLIVGSERSAEFTAEKIHAEIGKAFVD
jgi:shikimate dehydrogenase